MDGLWWKTPIKMDDLGHMVVYEIYIPTEGEKKKKTDGWGWSAWLVGAPSNPTFWRPFAAHRKSADPTS